jgi:beta-phosphoglucomutase family hydrolase
LISVAPAFDSHAPTNGCSPEATDPRALKRGTPVAREFDAVIFDMDGVVTRTAEVHAAAWKQMFDAFLSSWSAERNIPFREFTRQDYLTYVDGRPRYKGVEAFLRSRDIALPMGSTSDGPEAATICGLGNAKNASFTRIIARDGVGVYASTVALMVELRRRGVLLGLATSSRNSGPVLQQSGTADLFGAVIDGIVSEQRGLKGKPAPDIFSAAAAELGVSNTRAIVVEDAVSGVQAGARGGFALVIGVARENNARELRDNGADLVVRDLADITVEQIGRRVQAKRTAAS